MKIITTDKKQVVPIKWVSHRNDNNFYYVHIGTHLNIFNIITSIDNVDRFIVLYDRVLTDTKFLKRIYSIIDSLSSAQFFKVDSGESSKSLKYYTYLVEKIVSWGITRHSILINVGGGVIGDLGGFIAASLLRGIRFIQVPTTLLAQVDSSIGGKVGINTSIGKNLIGAFHQPELVITDLISLVTLPHKIFTDGMAEVIKIALLTSIEFLTWLECKCTAITKRDPIVIKDMIVWAVRIKADIISSDIRERFGRRILLNLGHTFAHGLESLIGYDRGMSHGQAVAIGIVMAAELSARLNMISELDVTKVKTILHAYALPIDASYWQYDINVEKLWTIMQFDKKNEAGILKIILLNALGEAVVKNVSDPTIIKKVIADSLHGWI